MGFEKLGLDGVYPGEFSLVSVDLGLLFRK